MSLNAIFLQSIFEATIWWKYFHLCCKGEDQNQEDVSDAKIPHLDIPSIDSQVPDETDSQTVFIKIESVDDQSIKNEEDDGAIDL